MSTSFYALYNNIRCTYILEVQTVVHMCRLWRNEVEHKKIERTLQLAAEMRQEQKMALIQAIWGALSDSRGYGTASPQHTQKPISLSLSPLLSLI